jgi:hypothetical protein
VWEQLNVAVSFDMTEIWILNVGDLKFLESPLEYFLSIAYDAPANPRAALVSWLKGNAARDFGEQHAGEIAEIIALYSVSEKMNPADIRCTPREGKPSC